MNKFKKKLTTLGIAALVALTAALPASASTVQSISIDTYSYYAEAADYGTHARIHVQNDGIWETDRAIEYTIYNDNGYVTSGILFSPASYGGTYFGYEFTGEFYNPSNGLFDVYIQCSPYGSGVCAGSATLEILE